MKIGNIWYLLILLIVSVGVRFPGLVSRAIWYDESITLLETSGNAQPSWPQQPTLARVAKEQFIGTPSLSQIATDLRETDVHPPVYYWVVSYWRRWLGFSLETARAFSLVCSVGAILVLFLLLQVGKFKYPIIPSLIFSISSGSVFAGHEARPYALVTLIILMAALFAYLASESRNRSHLVIYSTAMALCSGIAFHVNYLAIFPVLVILLWFLINLWPVSKAVAALALISTIAIWFLGIPTLLAQISTRPDQLPGFIGVFPEIETIVKSDLAIIYYKKSLKLRWLFTIVLLILLGTRIIYIKRHWSGINQKLFLMFLGLSGASSIGIFFLDLLFDKHLVDVQRYFLFAGPAFAVILTYGITPKITKKPLIMLLLILLVGLQLHAVNRGTESSPGWPGSRLRSLSQMIRDNSSPSQIVVIGAGYGRGHVGSVIYELDPETVIIVVDNDSNLDEMQSTIQNYDDVWFVPSVDNYTANAEDEILNGLLESEQYANIVRQPAIHLWQ